ETFVFATAAAAAPAAADRGTAGERFGGDLFRRVLEQSAEMFLYVQDAAGKLEFVSPGVAAVLGWTPGELAGRALSELRAEEDAPPRPGPPEGSMRYATFRHRDGGLRYLELVELPLPRPGKGSVQGLARDVTRQKEVEEQLVHEALHDPLTGLPNRALFMDRLQHTARSAVRSPGATYALLAVDVDDFKRINDGLGHEVGDRVLVEIATRLQRCVRPGDTVCRLGGDEFAVLLHAIGEARDATRVADRIRAELVSPFRYPPHELFVTTSIGIAVSSIAADDPRELLRHADTALYRAKDGGKARYEVFDRAMHESTLERLQLEADLRNAVRGDGLSLLYQPVVSVASGRISSFEALVRWRHPQRGTLTADQFVPVAEETGLVAAIDRWVLREACRQIQAWQQQFGERSPRVSVNVSARELVAPDTVEHVRRTLAETGAPASLLRLEVREGVLADPRAEAAVKALRATGVVVQMDHFGTVGSPVGLLRRLAIDGLKLAPSLLQQPAHADVLAAIVGLAHALNLQVVAGGIETEQQMTALRATACDFAQGYLVSAPVDAEQARRMLVRDLPV
ncbi:MAG TPA: EAL domain-containing protein, partial [Longimicrobium sp.]